MFAKCMLIALLGSMANAHMLMTSPVPYSKGSLNNSPLAADGSDFPCKLRADTFTISEMNEMTVGESNKLSFEGSATHGGGSCQISLTEDMKPTRDSKWKVIKSIEGGCPANVEGNMSENDNTVFNFTIPEGIEAGKYTLAWTWFNRIGNREMYMNCAPINVKSGASKRDTDIEKIEKRSANFPPMFVANVNGCTTKESIDIRFPQPGDEVERDGQESNLAPEGQAACTGTATFAGDGTTGSGSSGSSGSGSGSGSSGSGSGSSSAAPVKSSPAASASQPPAPASSASEAPTQPSSSAAPQPAAPSATQPVSSTPSSSGDSGAGGLTGSCSTEGAWNCIDGTSFQRCAAGKWSVVQQMASGTQCKTGQGAELSVSASKKTRSVSEMRFRKRHVGGPHHG
ncbi:hypothetical protein N7492_000621 [Penicillium capsulatum]|uniref:Lytic polysaccharide monooxygenase n=1 Tax=Penicillium capsulatum TaxID=69766 RepID=A0A9W9IQS3_9EURO|nr:hypothetical protein N7492_000621 [Penicillium capsulatum]KAJ6130321.1 hypothetical protein N7512_003101 [Penicillium capsulatum]